MLTKTYGQKPHRKEFAQFVWIWVPQKENTVFIQKILTIAGVDRLRRQVLLKSKTNLAVFFLGGGIKACNIPITLTLWWITAGTSTINM